MLSAEEETKESWHGALQGLSSWWEEKEVHGNKASVTRGPGRVTRVNAMELRMGEAGLVWRGRKLENILERMHGCGAFARLRVLGMLVGE